MESEVVSAAALAGSAGDFSMWALFWRADLLVKAVLLMLLAASVWSWAIIFEKFRLVRAINAQTDMFEDEFWSGQSLDDLYARMGPEPDHPMAMMFSAAMREWRRSVQSGVVNAGQSASVQERVVRVMRVTLNREAENLERYLGFLATVGSTAPFVGLFGTVWGIMNSFQAIAASHNTSLAVVAPGIAEALFATALGLVAAIPAVVAYNKFSGDMDSFATRLEGFSEEFSAILSRQLEVGRTK